MPRSSDSDLRARYERLPLDDLIRLRDSGELRPDAHSILEEVLAKWEASGSLASERIAAAGDNGNMARTVGIAPGCSQAGCGGIIALFAGLWLAIGLLQLLVVLVRGSPFDAAIGAVTNTAMATFFFAFGWLMVRSGRAKEAAKEPQVVHPARLVEPSEDDVEPPQ